ncbi:carboxyl transferase domain-containing protein [Streptomyces sp. NPDC048385]|uniref:carboxyl transferase domain-containing protein n=1 Tax=unclassified Streptomyces TaxID=2593676 RepID=UPI0034236ACA
MARILVANRGEIAVRIIRAIHLLGDTAVAVHAPDDARALHVLRADLALPLPGTGPGAYLDIEAVVAAAASCGADLVHPGYGFLSENAGFARACEQAGIGFIGPTPEVLARLGDKVTARRVAEQAGIPVPPGSSGPTTAEEARAFFGTHGPLMVKALSGGGGRGMREVHDAGQIEEAFDRCASEARAAFGDGALYVEKLLPAARHIEVQIVADTHGGVSHLWERDCSVQRRHQKLIEVAPSPSLAPRTRRRIIDAATRLAAAVGYHGIGTVEFLLDGDEFWFMEANPRLQVEHTITEAITGVDLVSTQIRLARGARLADCGLAEPPAARGFALQARLHAEKLDHSGDPYPATGTITGFALPSGPGVRVDTAGYAGWTVGPRYDPLLAKIITLGNDFEDAARRAAMAVTECGIDGVETNRALLHAILTDPDFLTGTWDTSYLPARLAGFAAHLSPPAPFAAAPGDPAPAGPVAPDASLVLPEGTDAVRAPMAGVVVSVSAEAGTDVLEAAPLLVLEAMKMEHVLRADGDLHVLRLLAAPGDVVAAGTPLVLVKATEGAAPAAGPAAGESRAREQDADEDWSAEVEEIARREAFARALGGPEKIARQHGTGRMTARERIAALADPGSFAEIGALAGFAARDERGAALSVAPTNFVAGTAHLDGRKVVLGVDDFTVRGGAGDAAIHAKQIYLEEYAHQMRLPMVRLLDGQSGGGSVKMALDAGYTYVPINPAWDAVVDNLSVVPVVAASLGPTVGLGAARLVMSHLAVMVDGVGQLFTAGPPLVRSATGEILTKDELGGTQVHRSSGAVERVVESEDAAFEVIRAFLSYLPRSVYEGPPVLAGTDPADRREDRLLSAIPHNKRRPYAIGPVLDAIFDAGSVFTYAEYGGGTVTALARLDGHPVGVIAADPYEGATMSVEGALAVTRLVDLCETFHLPVVSLTDQAGMTIGLAAERRGTIRYGARAISAVYQARVPQAELIVRRVYGVGGAGIVNRHRAMRSWAWPSGDWGSLPVQGGVEAAFRAHIEAADDPAAEADRLRTELANVGSPFRTAERFGVQDVIDPRDSRPLLCDWVRDAYRLIPTLLGRPAFGTRP